MDKFKARLSTPVQISPTYLPLENELTELGEGAFEGDLSFENVFVTAALRRSAGLLVFHQYF